METLHLDATLQSSHTPHLYTIQLAHSTHTHARASGHRQIHAATLGTHSIGFVMNSLPAEEKKKKKKVEVKKISITIDLFVIYENPFLSLFRRCRPLPLIPSFHFFSFSFHFFSFLFDWMCCIRGRNWCALCRRRSVVCTLKSVHFFSFLHLAFHCSNKTIWERRNVEQLCHCGKLLRADTHTHTHLCVNHWHSIHGIHGTYAGPVNN